MLRRALRLALLATMQTKEALVVGQLRYRDMSKTAVVLEHY